MSISTYYKKISMGEFCGNPAECHGMYCMDGRPGDYSGCDTMASMQKDTGFSSFPCCDYFIPKKGEIFLIEATRAADVKEGIPKKYKDISPYFQDDLSPENAEEMNAKLFNRYIKEECARKMYSSMAILERMARKCADFSQKIGDMPIYNFWLVIYAPKSQKDIKAMDIIKKEIKEALIRMPGASNKKVVFDVDVVTGDFLGQKLSELNASSP